MWSSRTASRKPGRAGLWAYARHTACAPRAPSNGAPGKRELGAPADRARRLRLVAALALAGGVAVLSIAWYAGIAPAIGFPPIRRTSISAEVRTVPNEHPVGGLFLRLLRLPWRATVGANSATDGADSPGPIPLAFIPLVLLVPDRVPRSAKMLLLHAGALILAQAALSPYLPSLLPVSGLIAICAASILHALSSLTKTARRAATAAIVFALIIQIAISSPILAEGPRDKLDPGTVPAGTQGGSPLTTQVDEHT